MFRRKETQIQQERVRQMSTQMDEYRRMMDGVDKAVSDATVELDQIAMSATRMDGSLTKVVDHARDTKEAQQASDDKLLAVTDGMTDCIQQMTQMQEAFDRDCEEVAMRQEELTDLVEHSKHYTSVSKRLAGTTIKYQEYTKDLDDRVSDMETFGNAIGALALHSAIEAGRMGDSGKQYIDAAEQIRDYSVKYQEIAAAFREDLSGLTEAFEHSAQDIHQLIQLLKENNVLLNKVMNKAAAQSDQMHRRKGQDAAGRLQEISGQLQQVQDHTRQSVQMQDAILGEMESVGACFLEEQECADKLEEILEGMKRTLSAPQQEQTEEEQQE